jgi:MSHA pilin protein MshD
MCIRRGLAFFRRGGHPGFPRPGRQAGATLIELIMFVMIISVALAGVISVLNVMVKGSADPMIRKQMLTLAESLLDEVELMPFTVCDPATNTNPMAVTTAECSGTSYQQLGYPALGVTPRSNYNNIGNYCSNAGPNAAACTLLTLGTAGSAASIIPDMSGSTAVSPPGYWATITLTPEAFWGIASSAGSNGANMNALRITVTVYHGDDSLALESYRTRWWPMPLITP